MTMAALVLPVFAVILIEWIAGASGYLPRSLARPLVLLIARERTRGKAGEQRFAELLAGAEEVKRPETERAALEAGWRAFGEAVGDGERMPAGHLPPAPNLPDWWRR